MPESEPNRCKSARESRGMQKIRAYLLQSVEEHWQTEVIRGSSPYLFPLKSTGISRPLPIELSPGLDVGEAMRTSEVLE
jgi:hypothetical protein